MQKYLEEEWTLVLSLRAGGPEPVREAIGLRGGDVVAQSERLLLQLLWWTVPGQEALSLALCTTGEGQPLITRRITSHLSKCWAIVHPIYSSSHISHF